MTRVSLSAHTFILVTCLFLGAVFEAKASSDSAAIAWEDICAITVCRGTGHDGVFSTNFAPNSEHLVVEVLSPEKSGLFLMDMQGKSTFWAEGSSAVWMASGKGIVYTHNNDLWSIKIGDDQPTRITNDEGDVRQPIVSPNDDFVVFASGRSGYQALWLAPLDGSLPATQLTKKTMPLDERRHGHSWSPDGKHIAYFSNSAEYWSDDLWLVNVSTKEQTRVTSNVMASGNPAWSPDGAKIAIYGTDKSIFWYTELLDIYVVDVAASKVSKVPMQVTAQGSGSPAWSKDSLSLFFPHHSRGENELWRVSIEGGVATRITHSGGVLHGWTFSPNGDTFALIRSTSVRGREIDLISVEGGNMTQLTQFASNWNELVEPEEISFKTEDGLYIQGFMFRPQDFDPSKSYPTVVQVHGGGTHSYYNGLNLVEQRLAQRGYVVLAINYRGGSGFGRSFQDLGANDWANTQALDAAAAADFIRAQSWSNGKVGIYGYSYGGIVSLAVAARAPHAFDAVVPMAGIYDFASAYENDNRLIRIFIKNGHGGTPTERPEIYAVSNTVRLLNQVKAPILLLHGESDTIAPFNQFEQAKKALLTHEKVFEAHSYHSEPHRFRIKTNRVDMYSRMEAWMDKWLLE